MRSFLQIEHETSELDLVCAVGGITNIDVGNTSRRMVITFGNSALEFVGALGLNETYGATSESCTCHPAAINTRNIATQLDHQVQFITADIVVITETAMRFVHQLTKPDEITCFESGGGLNHPGILSYHVEAAAIDQFR